MKQHNIVCDYTGQTARIETETDLPPGWVEASFTVGRYSGGAEPPQHREPYHFKSWHEVALFAEHREQQRAAGMVV